MICFDAMYIDEWKSQKCTHDYIERRSLLYTLLTYSPYPRAYFELLPELYRGSDTSKVLELLDEAIANQDEGIMINICDAPYEFGRTWNLMKVKKMNTLDLEIVGCEEGSGRLAGTLGAIHVRYKDGKSTCAKVLRIFAWLTMVIVAIVGIMLGLDTENFLITLACWVGGGVNMTIMFAIAEVLDRLAEISAIARNGMKYKEDK